MLRIEILQILKTLIIAKGVEMMVKTALQVHKLPLKHSKSKTGHDNNNHNVCPRDYRTCKVLQANNARYHRPMQGTTGQCECIMSK